MSPRSWSKPLTGSVPSANNVRSLHEALNGLEEVTVAGWVIDRNRNHIRIVDGTAAVESSAPDVALELGDLVMCRARPVDGALQLSDFKLINRSTPKARNLLSIWNASNTEVRYRHRYVDLRNPEFGVNLREAARLRQMISDFLDQRGFVYVETPILSRTQCEYTDDDYVVVSRFTDKGVYTLPQSAQLYKQLLMGSGIWRYYQLSQCFRDEPTRAESLTEFTQIDFEVSFSTEESLRELAESFLAAAFKEMKGIVLERPFASITLQEAMEKYGTDKPPIARDGKPVGLFITDIPMAYRAANGKLRGYHHPMMQPDPRHLPIEPDDDLITLRSTGFDIVIGGIEVGSGNMRISDLNLQQSILDHWQFSDQERSELLGTLLNGLEFAFPPHGGFGIGFERLLMLLTNSQSLQEVTAFPKLRRDWCPLTKSPFLPLSHVSSACREVLDSITSRVSPEEPGAVERQAHAHVDEEAPTAKLARAIEARGGCAFPMHIGDSWLGPPQTFTSAVITNLQQEGIFRYSAPLGLSQLRSALARRQHEKIGVSVDPDQVIICNGATEGTSAIIRSVMEPGDRALLLSPHWSLIKGQIIQHGCLAEDVPFFENGRSPSPAEAWDILNENFVAGAKLIYFASPNNPDGAILNEETLQAVLSFARERKLWIIADEVHEEQAFEPRQIVSARRLSPDYDRLVTIHSFSKLIGSPGIRVGFVIPPAGSTKQIARLIEHTTYCVPLAWQYGCLSALDDSSFFERQHAAFNDARLRTAKALGVKPPQGGIYHFFRVRGEAASIAQAILKNVDVALAPGEIGGASYGSWLRMCFTSLPLDQAEQGALRAGEWLREMGLIETSVRDDDGL